MEGEQSQGELSDGDGSSNSEGIPIADGFDIVKWYIYKPFNGINIGVFHDLDKLINIMQYISISQSKLESLNLIVIEIIIAANI